MKNIFLIILVLTICINPVVAQKKYSANVTLNTGRVKGRILSVTTDSLVLIRSIDKTRVVLTAAEIQRILIRKKGSISKGVLVGAVSGALLGFVIDVNIVENLLFSDEAYPVGMPLLIPMGLVIGAVSVSKFFKNKPGLSALEQLTEYLSKKEPGLLHH